MLRSAAAALTLACLACAACAPVSPAPAGTGPSPAAVRPSPVPPVAPDSVPRAVQLSYEWGSTPCMRRAVRNVVIVAFRREATQGDKQAAIDLVDGEVVGGYSGLDSYAVRIADDGTGAPVCRAVSLLRTLEQVLDAAFVLPALPPARSGADGPGSAPDGTAGPGSAPVPAVAPDTVPRWVRDPFRYAPDRIDASRQFITDVILRNVIVVGFRRTATQADREAAVAAVAGEVIGGDNPADLAGEGLYYVVIDDDGTSGPLFRAIGVLRSLPQVQVVLTATVDPGVRPQNRNPVDGSDPLSTGPAACLSCREVPMTVPELSQPAWFSDPARAAPCSGLMVGRCLVDVVDLRFHGSATQEQRADAIGLVGGEVVGGFRGAGLYYVQIPTDGTLEPLREALAKLRALPFVADAWPHSVEPMHLHSGRPNASLLAHADSSQRLAGGDTSGVKWIELRVHPGVERFRATLHARARRASPPVPPVPPDSVPLAVELSYEWGSTPCVSRAVRNVVIVAFRREATQGEKQAAIDLIDGEVVGGYSGLRSYVVRIADDGTGVPVCRAVSLLRTLEQVLDAAFELPALPPARSGADGPGRVPDGTAGPGSAPVPAVSPDSVPTWIRDPYSHRPEAIDSTGEYMTRRVLRNVVGIVFRPGTSVELKARAVGAVSGEVVGGERWGAADGIYYVEVPMGDGAIPLSAVIRRLESLPQVSVALAHPVGGWASAHAAAVTGRTPRASAPVPTEPPDSLPAWMRDPDTYAPALIDSSRAYWGVRILRNVVGIVFRALREARRGSFGASACGVAIPSSFHDLANAHPTLIPAGLHAAPPFRCRGGLPLMRRPRPGGRRTGGYAPVPRRGRILAHVGGVRAL